MRLQLRRFIGAAYLGVLVFGIFLFIWSYHRNIGITRTSPLRKTDTWILSNHFLFMERGVIAFGRQRLSDLSNTTWAEGQNDWKFQADPIRDTDPLLPPSFTYDSSSVWNRWGFGI